MTPRQQEVHVFCPGLELLPLDFNSNVTHQSALASSRLKLWDHTLIALSCWCWDKRTPLICLLRQSAIRSWYEGYFGRSSVLLSWPTFENRDSRINLKIWRWQRAGCLYSCMCFMNICVLNLKTPLLVILSIIIPSLQQLTRLRRLLKYASFFFHMLTQNNHCTGGKKHNLRGTSVELVPAD